MINVIIFCHMLKSQQQIMAMLYFTFSNYRYSVLSKQFNIKGTHYENMSMQYPAIFHGYKNDNFQMRIVIFLLKTLIVGTR